MLDPRTKLLLALLYAAVVVATQRPAVMVAEWGLLVAGSVLIGRGRVYLRWLRLVLPMAVFFGLLTWWAAGLQEGGMAAVKLLALTTAFFVFFETTAPEDIGNSLVRMGLPYPVAFVFAAAMQFVPVIGRKAHGVLDAQRSRGIPLERGWAALRHYPAFLGPLLIQAFQLAEELAEAMEARGFGRAGRTFYREYRLRAADAVAAAAGGLALWVAIRWW